MASKKQPNSPPKRTSHYYKKKLTSSQENPEKPVKVQNTAHKIQKIPKAPRLRAKQARERKKFYIEKLQEEIYQLKKELKTYKERSQIQSSNSAFINISRPDKPAQTTLEVKSILKKAQTVQYTQEIVKLAGIQNAFRRLYEAVHTKNQEEAQKCIDVLRKRYGISGQERIKWIEELMLKIVTIMMPMHCRLLLENCENRQEFYKLIGCSQNMKQQRKLYFDKNTTSVLCESRPAILEIKQQYKRMVQSMGDLSEQMIKEAGKLQKEIDKIEKSMNPLFVGRILVDLDVERKKKENLNEIFPVNFYKEEVAKMKEKKVPTEQVKSEQEDICYGSIDDDIGGQERISGFSDQEIYLMSILSEQ